MKSGRKPIVAGNWKMYKTTGEATKLINALKQEINTCQGVEVLVCPPFTALADAGRAVANTPIGLGAQNMHWAAEGAFTGEISANMLRDLGCSTVILGHSERRTLFGETDAIVSQKAVAALSAGLRPIICLGETLEQRKQGQTEAVVTSQLRHSLAGIQPDDLNKIVIAYEPVWAIGTGLTATPQEAQEIHALIRRLLVELADAQTAQTIRIQYGGSVKPANARDLFSQPDIDGGLIGGASLDAASFLAIIKGALC